MGVALASPVTLFLLLPAAWRQRRVRFAFLALPAATLAIYVGLRVLYTVVGQPLPPEEIFQQRVALSGFEHIPPLAGHLLAYSVAGTLLGFFMPADYPHPAASVAVVAFAAGVAFTLWRGDRTTRRLVVAMLVLWGGLYVMIAVGRAHIYAVLGMKTTAAAMVGRYHYAGLMPVVVVLCLVLRQLGASAALRRVPAGLALAAGVALWFSGYLGGDFRIDERRNCQDYFVRTQREIADAVRPRRRRAGDARERHDTLVRPRPPDPEPPLPRSRRGIPDRPSVRNARRTRAPIRRARPARARRVWRPTGNAARPPPRISVSAVQTLGASGGKRVRSGQRRAVRGVATTPEVVLGVVLGVADNGRSGGSGSSSSCEHDDLAAREPRGALDDRGGDAPPRPR
jgi:hypothetical protein